MGELELAHPAAQNSGWTRAMKGVMLLRGYTFCALIGCDEYLCSAP